MEQRRARAALPRVAAEPAIALSRRDRLERWATLIENCDEPQLSPLLGIEFLSLADRRVLRSANSPMAIAYRDPVLRGAGLAGDLFGDAIEFFELTPRQAHRLLCSCGYLGAMMPREVARRMRAIAERDRVGAWSPQEALARVLSRLRAPFQPRRSQPA